MNLLHSFLQFFPVHRIGWFLLHSVWQGTAAAVLLGILLAISRKSRPQVRYAIACIMLLIACLTPIMTSLMFDRTDMPAKTEATDRLHQPSVSAERVQPDARVEPPREFAGTPVAIAAPTGVVLPPPKSPRVTFQRIDVQTQVMPAIVLCWAIGVLFLSVWNLGGWLAVQQLRFLKTRPAGAIGQEMIDRLAKRLGLKRAVQLRQSALAKTPMVIGVIRPIILVPLSMMTELSVCELESILAHELAHIARHDYLINLLQNIVETVFFYHPAVWWISRQIRIERENCCDDIAIAMTRDRATYARALAAIASVDAPRFAPSASGAKLLPRLRRILQMPAPRSSAFGRSMAGALILCGLAIATLKFHPSRAADAAPPTTQLADVGDDTVRVHGRVLDPDGKPIVGARVAAAPAWPIGTERDRPAILSATTSGADGRFEISFNKSAASIFNIYGGQSGTDLWKKLNVVASISGFGMAWDQFDHVDAAGDLTLKLVPDLALEGRILDWEHHPIAGVKVIPTDLGNQMTVGPDYRSLRFPLNAAGVKDPIITDADGRFRIIGLGRERRAAVSFESAKVALIWTRASTHEAPWEKVPLGDNDGKGLPHGNKIELTGAPAISVFGIVRDKQTLQPLAGVNVRTTYSRFQASTVTDAQGHYQLDGLEKGAPTIEITASSDNEPFVPAILNVPAGLMDLAPVPVNFELQRGLWITGKVTDKSTGAPVPAEVDYYPFVSNKIAAGLITLREGRAQSPLSALTQADGSYRLVGLPGRGIVAARCRENQYRLGEGFDQIKDRKKDGHVNTFSFVVNEKNYNAVSEISLPDDAHTGTADFALGSGGSVSVTCVDPDGKPIAISVRGDRATFSDISSSNYANGQFAIVGLSPNEKRLVYVISDDNRLGKVSVIRQSDAKNGRLTIQLETVATITGRLLDAAGKPISQGRLRADTRIDDLGNANQIEVANEHSRDNGQFTLHLPPGCNYVLSATQSPYGGEPGWVNENLPVKAGASQDLGDLQVAAETK